MHEPRRGPTLNFPADAWRGLANATRTTIRKTKDPSSKEALWAIVRRCELLAELEERKLKRGFERE